MRKDELCCSTYGEADHSGKLYVHISDYGLAATKSIAADAILVRRVHPRELPSPSSWANRAENFSGLLLHWDDPIFKYNEVQVRIDGRLDDLVGDNLKLTFEPDGPFQVIRVFDYIGDAWVEIESGHTWPITESFEPFNILVQGGPYPGHTELILTLDPDPSPNRPIADKVFIIVNE